MKITTVELVRINPTFKLLYPHERNLMIISIIAGSGNFAVSANTTDKI